MGEFNQSGDSGEAAGPNGRLPSTEGRRPTNRPESDRESQSAGIWRRPGAGSVPTRPVEALFGFSTSKRDGPAAAEPAVGAVDDEAVKQARRRAFALLDDWLTWISVLEDESVFSGGRSVRRDARYGFELEGVLAEPVDVVRYSGKTSAFL